MKVPAVNHSPLLTNIAEANIALEPVRSALRSGGFPTSDPRRVLNAREAMGKIEAGFRALREAIEPGANG